jgi:hypothetical protein
MNVFQTSGAERSDLKAGVDRGRWQHPAHDPLGTFSAEEGLDSHAQP